MYQLVMLIYHWVILIYQSVMSVYKLVILMLSGSLKSKKRRKWENGRKKRKNLNIIIKIKDVNGLFWLFGINYQQL